MDLRADEAAKLKLSQHTPDYEPDDCRIHTSAPGFGVPWSIEDWKDEPINKVYYKPNPEVMRALGDRLVDYTRK